MVYIIKFMEPICITNLLCFKFGQYRYFDELCIGNSFEEVTLYNKIPEMFLIQENLKFIRNHK